MATTRYLSISNEIRRGLEDRKRGIAAEMRGYPQPIAGCDAQYQHLSDQRAAIARELVRLDRAYAAGAGAVAAFSASSDLVDDEVRRRVEAARLTPA